MSQAALHINSRRTALQVYRSSDPTRTLTIRRRYAREMRKRFRHLRGIIRDAIITKDAFGIKGGHEGIQADSLSAYQADIPENAFDFPQVQGKVSAFMEWLEQQVDAGILEVSDRRQVGQAIDEAWQNVFIEDTYKRGVQRATYEMEQAQFDVESVERRGGIGVIMSQPAHLDRLGSVFTRAYNELKGITDTMDQQISRVLAQGLADGDGPRTIARKLNKTISGRGGDLGLTDTLGRFIPAERRAQIMARTEAIRAHHQGMIQTYRNWGVEGISVQAEFRTAGDGRVCPECSALEGNFYTLDVAQNLIPVHPQCRCLALPARESDIPDDAEVIGSEDEVNQVIEDGGASASRPESRTGVSGEVPFGVRSGISANDIAQDLRSGNVVNVRPLKTGVEGGVNESIEYTLESGRKGLFKPTAGEVMESSPGNYIRPTITNKDFTLAQREVLASRLDEAMDLNLVPKTTFREVDGDVRGSIQLWLDDADTLAGSSPQQSGSFYNSGDPDEMYSASVFDYLIGNTDRHMGNFMVSRNRAVLIDNGYAFPDSMDWYDVTVHKKYAARTFQNPLLNEALEEWEQAVPGAVKQDLSERLNQLNIDDFVDDLGINQAELTGLKERKEELIELLNEETEVLSTTVF